MTFFSKSLRATAQDPPSRIPLRLGSLDMICPVAQLPLTEKQQSLGHIEITPMDSGMP